VKERSDDYQPGNDSDGLAGMAQSGGERLLGSEGRAAAEHGYEFVLHTHPGLIRPLNEDAVGAAPAAGLYILADGLGGYNAGEIASTMAVSSLLQSLSAWYDRACASGESFDPAKVLRDALVEMNTAIYRAALNSSAFEGMATTIVVAWVTGTCLWVAHAGDSRLYRYRAGHLEQITRDHSFSQELLDAGMVTEEEARVLPAKNLVTRALGAAVDLEPEVRVYDAQAGDLLLLCSDGLTEMITAYEIDGLMAMHDEGLDVVAHHLVDMANEAGGRDNISVVLVRVGQSRRNDELLQTRTQQEPSHERAAAASAVNEGPQTQGPDTLLPPDSGLFFEYEGQSDGCSDLRVLPVI